MTDPWTYNGCIFDCTLLDIFHIENIELLELLHDIDITKSSAIDNISCRVMKDIS